MITARNYAAQAEAGLIWYSDRCFKMGRKIDAFKTRVLAYMIKNSVHFVIPDDGEIFDDDLRGLRGESLRLPYEGVTVEYFVKKNDENVSELAPMHAPKRVAVASDVNKEQFFSLLDEQNRYMLSEFPGDRVISVYAVNIIEGINYWIPMTGGWLLPREWDAVSETAKTLTPLVPKEKRSGVRMAGIPVILLEEAFDEYVKNIGYEMAMRNCIHDIAPETRSVLELCEALSCSNVTTDVIQPASPKNAKRIADKKLPIYETRCLSIVVPTSTNKPATGIGGTHKSPRQHLRRGHIRRLHDDRKIWVNSCVVGAASQGVINKTYKVST
jgi:hypothetical protein